MKIDRGSYSDVKAISDETKEKTHSGEWECYLIFVERAVAGGWESVDSLGSSVHAGGFTGTYSSPAEIANEGLRGFVQEMWDAAIIEHAEQVVTMPLGLAVGFSKAYSVTLGVIGAIEKSNAGNTVLRVGNHTSGESGWVQAAHVVLTPAEREKLIAELIAQR
ncbi:hypothetical protein ACIOHC_36315 [Streptomyces sp. NPDC088252]|uniref:hypothetical protein n=1 Tax=Streptomyces sp. NPDC088252 TaxID=3365845 RepID=UPI0037F924A8